MAILKRTLVTLALLLAQGQAGHAFPLTGRLGGCIQPKDVGASVQYFPRLQAYGDVGITGTPWRLGGFYQASYLHFASDSNTLARMTHQVLWAGYERELTQLFRFRLMAGWAQYEPNRFIVPADGTATNVALTNRRIAAVAGSEQYATGAMVAMMARFQSGPIWLELTPSYTFGTQAPNEPLIASGLPSVAMGYRVTPHLEVGFQPWEYTVQATWIF